MFWDTQVEQPAASSAFAEKQPFDASAFGERLRLARTQRTSYNQTQMARALGMSQPTYSRMENGQVESARVTSALLDQLQQILGRTMSWFLYGSPVRDRVLLAARRTDEAEIRGRAERVLDLLEVDAELDEAAEFAAPSESPLVAAEAPRWPDLQESSPSHASRQQGRELAERMRRTLGVPDGPIEDLPGLLEQGLGVDVAVLALGEGLSAVVAVDEARARAVLTVNVNESYARQRFSFAHELAHLLYGEGHAYEHGPSRSPIEIRADKFAQTFLLPSSEVIPWASAHAYVPGQRLSFDDACTLADDYGVSPAMAWIALKDLNIAPQQLAPSAAAAAAAAGQVVRHQVREQTRRIERVPRRMERRILDAFRQGLLPATTAASLLGQDATSLTELVDLGEAGSGSGRVRQTSGLLPPR